jgi:hypothetical protein
MMREIRDQVRGEAESLGIEIVDVRIRRTELMPDVLQDTYARMSAERFAEAAELRAIGQAQATRIEAEADRAAVELLATAQRESEIIRGEGDAERNLTFADAFGRDGLLQLLSLDAGLYQEPGRHRHDPGAQSGLGVLPALRHARSSPSPSRSSLSRCRPRRPVKQAL